MNLQQQIKAWDGKAASDIRAIYQQYQTEPRFIHQIIKLIENAETQIGASWLLKTFLESGNTLGKPLTSALFKQLDKLPSWQTQLHILQSLPYLNISIADQEQVYTFLQKNLVNDNKFVRAWAYNGFYVLSQQHPQYQQQTQKYFEMAMRDEAASVKARIRQINKQSKQQSNKESF